MRLEKNKKSKLTKRFINFGLFKMKKLFRNIDKFGKMLYNKDGG